MKDCVFCSIVAGTAPADIVCSWSDAVAFVPLGPVISGHVLVVPRIHIRDATESSFIAGLALSRAAELAAEYSASNLIISNGANAKQSIFHLHVHVIPRTPNDQLMVPWGTTGDPHAPHYCAGMERLSAELAEQQKELTRLHKFENDFYEE